MILRYLLPLLAIASFGFAFSRMSQAQQKPPAAVPPVEPARSPFKKQLAGAGIVEPETENISIGTHVPGVVERVFVKVGQTVVSGSPLFRLDDRHVQADLQVRLANLAAMEAQESKLAMLPRPEELPPAKAKVSEAESRYKDEVKMYERIKPLAGTPAVSDDEVFRRRMSMDMAYSQLLKVQSDVSLLEAGAWGPDKLVSAAATRMAKAQVEQTRTDLDRLTVKAPRADKDGTEFKVLQVNVRPGEYVGTLQGTPLVVLGTVGKLHVRVDIDENDIPRFAANLPGVAKPRGNSNHEFAVKFVRIEPYVIPKKSLTGGNTERVDTRVLQVIYELDTKGKTLFVGQQMDVFLDANDEKPLGK